MDTTLAPSEALCYELRFRPLQDGETALAFPCDAAGQVDLDALSGAARTRYLYARTVVGRAFASPTVRSDVRH